MQITETLAEGLKREFKVVIAAGEIGEKVGHRLEELSHQVSLPGFRPGKVPRKVVEQRYRKAVLGEVLESAVGDSSRQAIMERGLKPAMQPKIEVTKFDDGTDLEYTMRVEVMPEIQPMDFAKLELERLKASADDVAVEDLKRFEEELTTFAEESHPGVLNTLRDKRSIDDDLKAAMKEAVEDFKATRWETAAATAA